LGERFCCRRAPAPWANASAAGERLRLGDRSCCSAGRLRLGWPFLLPATAIHNYLKIPVDTVPMI